MVLVLSPTQEEITVAHTYQSATGVPWARYQPLADVRTVEALVSGLAS